MDEIEFKKHLKKVEIKMGLFMGATLSFFLSLTGLLTSGHFTWPALFLNFGISFVISLLIGYLIPLRKIADAFDSKLGFKPGQKRTHFFDTLISDLIYTPLITFCMVFIAWKQAASQGVNIPFGSIFLPALLISLAVGYVLICILTPVFLRLSGAFKYGKPE